MTSLEEQETTLTATRTDDVVRVYTSDARHLRRFRKLVTSGDFVREVRGGDDWGEFVCDVEFFFLFSAFRRKRRMSDADRARRAEILARARAGTSSSLAIVDEVSR